MISPFFMVWTLCAQTISGVQTDGNRQSNIITAVPFLLITPQARAGAMGNAGVAVDGNENALAMNVATLAFLPEKSGGISLAYSPWLKTIAKDINISYLSGFYRLDDRNTLAGSLRYFSLGNVELTDANFQSLGNYSPNELAFDLSFTRSLGPNFALGGTLRYIHSGLYNIQSGTGGQAKAAQAVAVDVTGILKKEVAMFGKPAVWSLGLNLSNMGTKVGHGNGARSYFLPANLKLGTAARLSIDNESALLIAIDLNKLMVPTEPIYHNNGEIIAGKDPDRSVPSGILGSFSDAPGGFSEELKELGISTGLEYSYQQKFWLRAGYNYQDIQKGNGRYLTLGAGLRYHMIHVDFAYIAASVQQTPLANTLRFTLGISMGKNRNKTD